MGLEIAGALAVAAVLVIAGVAGRRIAADDQRKKMELLSRFDGQDVVMGILLGDKGPIVQKEGRLRVGDTPSSLVLTGKKDRLVFLSQVRWIENPETGDHYGDRWADIPLRGQSWWRRPRTP